MTQLRYFSFFLLVNSSISGITWTQKGLMSKTCLWNHLAYKKACIKWDLSLRFCRNILGDLKLNISEFAFANSSVVVQLILLNA